MTTLPGLEPITWVWSLSTRLVFWSSLLFLGCLAFVTGVTLWGVPHTRMDGWVARLRTERFLQLNTLADQHKKQIESWLVEKRNDLHAIAHNNFLQTLPDQPLSEPDRARIREYLQLIVRNYPEFDFVERIDMADRAILSSADQQARLIVNDAFFKNALLSGRGYVGRAIMLEDGNLPVFRLGQPVRGSDGRAVALIVAAVSPDRILDQLIDAGRGIGESGDVLLVDEEIRLVSPAKYPLRDGTRLVPLVHRLDGKPALLAAGGHEGIIEALDYRGVPVVAAYRHIRISPEWGLGLVVKMDQEELFAPLQREVYTVLWTGIVGFLLLVSLSAFMVRQQTGRLRILSHTTAHLSGDDLAIRSGIRGRDEVGILGIAFDRMAERMQSSIQDLRQEAAEHQRTVSELIQINEELRNFTYIVSHDLRSPLLSVQGFSEELQMDIDELSAVAENLCEHPDKEKYEKIKEIISSRFAESLKYIRASTNKMDGLINAILHLSRLGRKVLQFEALDMQTLVEDNVKALGYVIKESGITITVGKLPNLIADRTAMEQIIGNLLANAIKYLDHQRAGIIKIHGKESDDGKRVTLQIEDNGRGISKDDIPKVFILFQRVGRQDTVGEGMGLSYVRTLVRRLGGRITCESTLGVGTVFSVTLPTDPTKSKRYLMEAT